MSSPNLLDSWQIRLTSLLSYLPCNSCSLLQRVAPAEYAVANRTLIDFVAKIVAVFPLYRLCPVCVVSACHGLIRLLATNSDYAGHCGAAATVSTALSSHPRLTSTLLLSLFPSTLPPTHPTTLHNLRTLLYVGVTSAARWYNRTTLEPRQGWENGLTQ